MKTLFKKYFELTVWSTALILPAVMPADTDPHFSLCIFKFAGIDFCPGCGLGHSISYLFHGNFQASFSSHPLGIFAVIIILFRIYKLLQLHLYPKKLNNDYAIRKQQ